MLGALLRQAFDNVRWLLEDVDEADCFWEPASPCWSVRLPIHRLVSTMALEHIHHGAEIGLLRDLRRGHARVQPLPMDEAAD